MKSFVEDVLPLLNEKLPANDTTFNEELKRLTESKMSTVQNELKQSLLDQCKTICANTTPSIDRKYTQKLNKMYKDVSSVRSDPVDSLNKFTDLLESSSSSDQGIIKQSQTINERNTDAAVKSLELAFLYCDNILSHRIESGAKSMEQVIPKLSRNLTLSRAEFKKTHNSYKLMEEAVDMDYSVLRDGYSALLAKYYSETAAQLAATSGLDQGSNRWLQDKLNAVLEYRARDEKYLAERERVARESSALFSGACDATFDHLVRTNTFEEVEEQFRRLEEVRLAVFRWKERQVAHSEAAFNSAHSQLEDAYLGHLEDLTARLAGLRAAHTKLVFYQRTLEQDAALLRGIQQQETLRNQRVAGRLSVAEGEYFRREDEEAAAIRALGIQEDALRVGTRLHAVAVSLGMPPEDVEAMLLEMLPSAAATAAGRG